MVYLEVSRRCGSLRPGAFMPQDSSQPYGIKAMEEEIVSSTLSIEQIDTSRDSVRKILSGYAPANESEKRICRHEEGAWNLSWIRPIKSAKRTFTSCTR